MNWDFDPNIKEIFFIDQKRLIDLIHDKFYKKQRNKFSTQRQLQIGKYKIERSECYKSAALVYSMFDKSIQRWLENFAIPYFLLFLAGISRSQLIPPNF